MMGRKLCVGRNRRRIDGSFPFIISRVSCYEKRHPRRSSLANGSSYINLINSAVTFTRRWNPREGTSWLLRSEMVCRDIPSPRLRLILFIPPRLGTKQRRRRLSQRSLKGHAQGGYIVANARRDVGILDGGEFLAIRVGETYPSRRQRPILVVAEGQLKVTKLHISRRQTASRKARKTRVRGWSGI